MLASIKKNGRLLSVFAAATTSLVALTHYFTAPAIAIQEQNQVLRTLNELIPLGSYDNDLFNDCTLVTDKAYLGQSEPSAIYRARLGDTPVAAAIEAVAPNGYNGKINLLVVMNADASIAGARVISHNETPGLGDKIETRKGDWILSFSGTQIKGDDDKRWAVKKDGGMFDQFTGATITPRAVVGAVYKAAQYYQQHQSDIFAAAHNCREVAHDD